MREFHTFRNESVDSPAKTLYSVESFHPLTPVSIADPIIDSSLSGKESKTERYRMPYRFVEVFVPGQWKGFD
jgi:hypothetical protein